MNKRYFKDYFWEDLIVGHKITLPLTGLGFIIWQAYLYTPPWVAAIAVSWLGIALIFIGASWMIGAFYNATQAYKKAKLVPAGAYRKKTEPSVEDGLNDEVSRFDG